MDQISSIGKNAVVSYNEIRVNRNPEKANIVLQDHIPKPHISHNTSFKDVEGCVAMQHDACPHYQTTTIIVEFSYTEWLREIDMLLSM